MEIDVSKLNTSKVINMQGMFDSCPYLTSLDLSNFDTNKVTNMVNMFYNCTGLKELDISNFDTSKVTDMSAMFIGANKLKTIYASEKFNTEKIWDSQSLFVGTTSIVWWKWTVFDGNHINKEYARIDGWEDNPWYFTDILDKEYTITYQLWWWEIVWSYKTGYTQRTSYTLAQPVRKWYIFKWWTWSNGNTPEKNVTTEWKKWNLRFIANWEQEKEDSWNNGWWGWSSSNTEKKKIDNTRRWFSFLFTF